jgi:hypothetical protein
VLVQQTAIHFRAYVAVSSSDGSVEWGYAEEPKYGLSLKLAAGGSLVFRMVLEDRPDALALCLAKALQRAVGRLSTPESLSQQPVGSDKIAPAPSGNSTPRILGPGEVTLKQPC